MTHVVPYYFSNREFASCRESIMGAVEAAFESGQVLQGQAIGDLEQTLSEATGREHCVVVNSCTDALYFALLAAGVSHGDEVIVPDLSFVATASAILRAGAVPIFCDVGPDYNLDLDAAASSVTSRTRGMVMVQLFGHVADPELVAAFAQQHELVLVEDAAQALGGTRAGRPAGSLGVASCLSFDPTKPIGCPGTGGAVLTDDAEVAERARRLRYHGFTPDGDIRALGFNSQLPTAAAAILNLKLDRMAAWMNERRKIADEYRTALGESRSVVLPPKDNLEGDTYSKFVIRVPGREEVRRRLDSAGIETRVHYAKPLHEHTIFQDCARSGENPNASEYAEQVLSLPIHPFLTSGEVDQVVRELRSAMID